MFIKDILNWPEVTVKTHIFHIQFFFVYVVLIWLQWRNLEILYIKKAYLEYLTEAMFVSLECCALFFPPMVSIHRWSLFLSMATMRYCLLFIFFSSPLKYIFFSLLLWEDLYIFTKLPKSFLVRNPWMWWISSVLKEFSIRLSVLRMLECHRWYVCDFCLKMNN